MKNFSIDSQFQALNICLVIFFDFFILLLSEKIAFVSHQHELRRVDLVEHLDASLGILEGSVGNDKDVVHLVKCIQDISINNLDLIVESWRVEIC